MTRSLHKIITLCFLALHPLAIITGEIQPTRTDISVSQNIRPSGSYFGSKKGTVRHPGERTAQQTRDLGNHYLNELQYEKSLKDEKGIPTCPSEKTLEKKICGINWLKTPRNHQVGQTAKNPGFSISNFIKATKLTEKLGKQAVTARDIQNTVTDAIISYHPRYNKKHPVVFAEWHSVARREKEIVQRIATARKRVQTPQPTTRDSAKTAR